MPDGTLHRPWHDAETLPLLLEDQLEEQRQRQSAALAGVTGFDHPAARTIRPAWAGERFDLGDCVQALFGMNLPEQGRQAA